MLVAVQMQRSFILKEKNQEIELADPDPKWTVQTVLNFYSNTYSILTTAKVSGPVIVDDRIQYRFESVIGTKG